MTWPLNSIGEIGPVSNMGGEMGIVGEPSDEERLGGGTAGYDSMRRPPLPLYVAATGIIAAVGGVGGVACNEASELGVVSDVMFEL
jgi:hypothetical protein